MKSLIRASIAAAMGLVLAIAASAQQPNEIVAHFRAYRAALDQGDLATAERETGAAYDASVAKDGDGGATSVLAINLAQVRLNSGRRAEAYEPALRAFTIASTVPGAQVDPVLARLVLGRAELTEAHDREGRERLSAALQIARANASLDAETYAAAADLGRWHSAQNDFAAAANTWDIAQQKADAAGGENGFARAEARLNRAAAMIARAMVATVRAQARPTDTRIGANVDRTLAEADATLLEAQNIFGPDAYLPAPASGLTLAQLYFAQTMAWRTMAGAFAEARGLEPTNRSRPDFMIASDDPRPLCETRMPADPLPNFPPNANGAFLTGAVVVRVQIDEAGNVIDRQVAAAIPDRWFREAVERVAPQWRLERLPSSAPNCRFPAIRYVTVAFTFR